MTLYAPLEPVVPAVSEVEFAAVVLVYALGPDQL